MSLFCSAGCNQVILRPALRHLLSFGTKALSCGRFQTKREGMWTLCFPTTRGHEQGLLRYGTSVSCLKPSLRPADVDFVECHAPGQPMVGRSDVRWVVWGFWCSHMEGNTSSKGKCMILKDQGPAFHLHATCFMGLLGLRISSRVQENETLLFGVPLSGHSIYRCQRFWKMTQSHVADDRQQTKPENA